MTSPKSAPKGVKRSRDIPPNSDAAYDWWLKGAVSNTEGLVDEDVAAPMHAEMIRIAQYFSHKLTRDEIKIKNAFSVATQDKDPIYEGKCSFCGILIQGWKGEASREPYAHLITTRGQPEGYCTRLNVLK